jgi:hypothetical protein
LRKHVIVLAVGLFILPLVAGASWTTKRLTWSSGDSKYPAIALGSNNYIHVVWEDTAPGNTEIFYKKSTNGGVTWTSKRLTWNSGFSLAPVIALDSNDHIYVVWWDGSPGNGELFMKKSTDGGAKWASQRLTQNSGDSKYPYIAIDSNDYVHLVWEDYSSGGFEIYHKKSTDGGATWSTKRLTFNTGNSQDSAIAVDSIGHIHVVWWDDSTYFNEIYYKKSTDGGTTWSTQQLTDNGAYSYYPKIALDSNNHIYVTWHDDASGNNEVYMKKSTNGGATWTTKRLTWNSGFSGVATPAIDSNDHIHVGWSDSSPGNNEIYYKKSTDGGATWAKQRLTWNSGVSTYPDVAIDSNNKIHLVWMDGQPPSFEIFFKKEN